MIAFIATMLAGPVSAAEFKDVPAGKWFYVPVTYCKNQGFVSGYSDGTFKPNNNITRAEFCVMLNKVSEQLKLKKNNVTNIESCKQYETKYSDYRADKWYSIPVANCLANGYISGTSTTTLSLNAYILRQDVAVMIDKMFGWTFTPNTHQGGLCDDEYTGTDQLRYWLYAMYRFIDLGIYQGDANWNSINGSPYKNKKPITRAEMCTVFKYILENQNWINARESKYIKADPDGYFFFIDKADEQYYNEWFANISSGNLVEEFEKRSKTVKIDTVSIEVLDFSDMKKTQPSTPTASPSAIPEAVSPYDPVIENTIKYLQGQSYDSSFVADGNVHLIKTKGKSNASSSVGYLLTDLDHDGSDELLIGDISSIDKSDPELSGFYRYFWLLYTIENGKAKLVTESWERNRHYLGADGDVYYEGSGGASHSYFFRMQFRDHDLYIVESAFSDIYNGSPCFCYSNLGSGVKESADDPRTVNAQAADRRNLGEQEWNRICTSFQSQYTDPALKPLTAYKSGESSNSSVNPNAIIGIQAAYSGSTEEGTILDKNNSGISVVIVYGDGHTAPADDWSVLSPVTLIAGETATVTIYHGARKCDLQVFCTTDPGKQYKPTCTSVTYNDLANNSASFIDKHIKISGRIFSNPGLGSNVVLYMICDGAEAKKVKLNVSYTSESSRMQLNDEVTVYGEFRGMDGSYPSISVRYFDIDTAADGYDGNIYR